MKRFAKSPDPRSRFARANVFDQATASSYPMTHVAFQAAYESGWKLSRSLNHNPNHLRQRKPNPLKMMGARFSEMRMV